jgi:cytochrome c-type biogenesis protein CcmH/NrfF
MRSRILRSRLSSSARNPIFWARILQTAILGIVAITMLGAVQSSYDRIGHQLMCSCTCRQILVECNHVGCPDSARMINELRSQIATGGSDTAILQWFAAKYGATVLAAPIRGGFDNVAWIVPIAVFLLATAGTFVIVWIWKRRSLRFAALTPAPQFTPPSDPAVRDRIRRETEYQ